MPHLKYIIALCTLLCVAIVDGMAQTSPSWVISFEQTSMEIGDSVTATVLITNTSSDSLTHVQLRVDGPTFFSFYTSNGQPITGTLNIGDIPAHARATPIKVGMAVAKNARVGTFNILFTLLSATKEKMNMQQNQDTIEKPVTIGLFGTDKIVGIPLAFAGFIVPGLVFLFVLRLSNVPIGKDIGADDKIVTGILISVVCLFLISALKAGCNLPLIQQFNVDQNISISKLFILAITGLLLGALVISGFYIYRFIQKQRQEGLVISGSETTVELLTKILKLNPKYEGISVKFTLENREYIAAHYIETAYSYILFAAYKIDKDQLTEEDKRKLKKYSQKNSNDLLQKPHSLLNALQLFKDAPQKLDVRNLVKVVSSGNKEDADSEYVAVSKEDAVVQPEIKEKNMKLLEVV